MREALPVSDFEWMTKDEIACLNIDDVPDDAPTGYILEASHCRSHTVNNHSLTCFKCGRKNHKADACWSGANDRPQASCVYSLVRVTNREGIRNGYLELKIGERIPIDTPYYSGVITALCMAEALYDLILGNIEGARAPDDPKTAVEQPISSEPSEEEAVAAVVTRAQPLNRNYADDDEEDEWLKQWFSQFGKKLMCSDSGGKIEFQREGGLLYRS
ncbi:hypothetical protein HPB47_020195 [Ixodes persulcatus]|uniref:Uncharacterized protein n=1 Tax=Ixodes persulcatus TaxID=34615 RepID=A0AC60QFZ8_IXOPE|nr:hypothetical protein HPB47_020195 [Ixodes persulcatus]